MKDWQFLTACALYLGVNNHTIACIGFSIAVLIEIVAWFIFENEKQRRGIK